jgi:serine/threonine-protein kinase HipA
MSGRAARVLLGELSVGELVEDDAGYIEFKISQHYRDLARRPVLGQWFEDHRHRNQRGARPGGLPAFFDNLIPEGDLRLRLEDRLEIAPADDFGFLCAVGRDLPGAIVVHPQEGDLPSSSIARRAQEVTEPGLRFSLAGVQLKFSMKRDGDRLTMPGRDDRGEWIVKIAFDSYPTLCANEWLTMEWARLAGFDVPTTELRTLGELVGVPHEADPSTPVFVIRRYDRDAGNRRIHQEDFQQIVGRRPHAKYDDITCEGLTLLATRIVGDMAYPEMLRRLAFVVASGNNDAHMKNWSVIYPDGIHAQLSPLYDQVFTAQWPDFAVRMALKLGGTKEFASLTISRFRELATRLHQPPDDAEEIVVQTITQIASAWAGLRDHPLVTKDYRDSLQHHWRKVPLLQPHALLV